MKSKLRAQLSLTSTRKDALVLVLSSVPADLRTYISNFKADQDTASALSTHSGTQKRLGACGPCPNYDQLLTLTEVRANGIKAFQECSATEEGFDLAKATIEHPRSTIIELQTACKSALTFMTTSLKRIHIADEKEKKRIEDDKKQETKVVLQATVKNAKSKPGLFDVDQVQHIESLPLATWKSGPKQHDWGLPIVFTNFDGVDWLAEPASEFYKVFNGSSVQDLKGRGQKKIVDAQVLSKLDAAFTEILPVTVMMDVRGSGLDNEDLSG